MSSISRTYLDTNATAVVRPEVIDLVSKVMAEGGNASSVHGSGRIARARVEKAREQVAELVNCLPAELIFTGCGTEATDLALNGVAKANGVTDIVLGAVEHPASFGAAAQSGLEVGHFPVTPDGAIDLIAAESLLDSYAENSSTIMAVVMRANNETGVLQPVAEVGQMIRDRKLGLLHCDAVQAAGKIPVDAVLLGADTMALSAHKMGGPQGVGALVVREGVAITPRIAGGGQEMGRRSGTLNVAGIAGFGLAAELARANLAAFSRISELRDHLESALEDLGIGVIIFGQAADRLPNTCNFACPSVTAETALMAMDLEGVEVSIGSACSSGKVAENGVLAAMGVEDALRNKALRISLGWHSTKEDVDRFLNAWTSRVLPFAGVAPRNKKVAP